MTHCSKIMSNLINVLSFDPGLSNTGWTHSTYNTDTKQMIVQHIGMLYPNKRAAVAAKREEVVLYGSRVIALTELREQICDLVETYHPDVVVSEDAFYSPRTPGAYGALLTWISTVSIVLYDKYRLPLHRIAPRAVKQILAGSGDTKKFGMQEAVLANDTISFSEDIDPHNLTEHMYDSIGIGYSFVKEILPHEQLIERFDKWVKERTNITLTK